MSDFEAGMDIHLTQDKAGRLDYGKSHDTRYGLDRGWFRQTSAS